MIEQTSAFYRPKQVYPSAITTGYSREQATLLIVVQLHDGMTAGFGKLPSESCSTGHQGLGSESIEHCSFKNYCQEL